MQLLYLEAKPFASPTQSSVTTEISKKGGKTCTHFECSAILQSGKAIILGNLGAHLLTVTATIVE